MSLDSLGLFRVMGEKVNWLTQRQAVTSQNIANADTPNYRPKDLEKFDFKEAMFDRKGGLASPSSSINMSGMAVSEGQHLSKSKLKAYHVGDPSKQRKTYEVAPAGNAVIIEEQMLKAGQTAVDYEAVSNLYTKHLGFYMTSLGRGQK